MLVTSLSDLPHQEPEVAATNASDDARSSETI
jgi:hypothetical protein